MGKPAVHPHGRENLGAHLQERPQLHPHGLDELHDRDATFLSAVYYYHTPKPFLVLTDTLDVGKPDAEAAHNYRMDTTGGWARLQTDTSGYEGDNNGMITDEGRWTDKGSSFTVKINPDNDGVRMRRRINQMAYLHDPNRGCV